jgi:hypothetical protein
MQIARNTARSPYRSKNTDLIKGSIVNGSWSNGNTKVGERIFEDFIMNNSHKICEPSVHNFVRSRAYSMPLSVVVLIK